MTQSSSPIQHRHFIELNNQDAYKAGGLLEAEFEEDGLAVSLFESDEKNNIWCVSIYVLEEASDQTRERMQATLQNSGLSNSVQTEIIEAKDWVAETLSQLSAVRAGRFLVHGSHEPDIARAGEIAVTIDAGLAFGTGHHGTTAGCLEMLAWQMKRRNFYFPLDLGTGSGVLAIAFAKATKNPVLASDIDPTSTWVAKENARLNNVGQLVECVTAKGFNHRAITNSAPFDLIIANILARPLQDMARDFVMHMADNGIAILSGLLPHQRARIISAFRIQGLKLVKSHIRDGWLTLVLQK